jgi:hypothetical protein
MIGHLKALRGTSAAATSKAEPATPPTPSSGVGYNFRCILAWLRVLLRRFLIAILRLLISRSTLIPVS